jgi:hypothetical protein
MEVSRLTDKEWHKSLSVVEWLLLAQSGRSKHRLGPVQEVLRDCNDLKLLIGCTDYIPNSFAHQKSCHRRYEGNRAGLRVRFVLSHDTIFLYAPIVAPEGHRATKGNSVS